MEIKSFDTILTEMCDTFDSLISPKAISRTNTNIVYLMFKAISKGYEVINNVCVTLSNKFNPSSCSVEDLNSVAELVGTEKYKGSSSGLRITVTNNSEENVTLRADTYTYALDADTTFAFEVQEDTVIEPSSYKTYVAMSLLIGSYPVTEQNSITVNGTLSTVDSKLKFSCADNSALLGSLEETDVEFRTRINSDVNRQDNIVELQTTLKNLPYLFDSRVLFNNSLLDYVYDGITIPSYHMAIFYSGSPKNEIAEIVAEKGIYPTVQTTDSILLKYMNDVFTEGYYGVNIIPFNKVQYSAKVQYKLNSVYTTAESVESQIRSALFNKMNSQVHSDYVKENTLYEVISSLDISGAELLNVNLIYNGVEVDYITVPLSRISELTTVTFEQE